MTKNTTDEQMKHYEKIIEQFDSVHMPAKQREIIMTEIEQLISNREKLLLDRVEKEVVGENHPKVTQRYSGGVWLGDTQLNWTDVERAKRHFESRNTEKTEQRKKLATLRKELDGGRDE